MEVGEDSENGLAFGLETANFLAEQVDAGPHLLSCELSLARQSPDLRQLGVDLGLGSKRERAFLVARIQRGVGTVELGLSRLEEILGVFLSPPLLGFADGLAGIGDRGASLAVIQLEGGGRRSTARQHEQASSSDGKKTDQHGRSGWETAKVAQRTHEPSRRSAQSQNDGEGGLKTQPTLKSSCRAAVRLPPQRLLFPCPQPQ